MMKLRISLTLFDERGYTLAEEYGDVPVMFHVPKGRDGIASAVHTVLDAAENALWNIIIKLIPKCAWSIHHGE